MVGSTVLGWEDLDGVGLESRRGRGAVCVCEEDVAWHVERAERAVRVGVNRRAAVQVGMTGCGRERRDALETARPSDVSTTSSEGSGQARRVQKRRP